METKQAISIETISRLPKYLAFLREYHKKSNNSLYISSAIIAEHFEITPIVVKKDLAKVSTKEGRPRMGFLLPQLIEDIEDCLGYNNVKDAVLVGVGRLGGALLDYDGFRQYGLNIVAGIDRDQAVLGISPGGRRIVSLDNGAEIIKRLKIHLGIIAVPGKSTQEVCDYLIECGIKGIWNFSPTHLKTPDNIVVKNEDMASSLAVLSIQLKETIHREYMNLGEHSI